MARRLHSSNRTRRPRASAGRTNVAAQAGPPSRSAGGRSRRGPRRAAGWASTFAGALVAGTLVAGAARAEAPQVAVDIAPLHALVAQVAGERAEPELLLPPGMSPHGYSLRPSEARALQSADLVVWVGPELTPWLDSALGTLAAEARVVSAMEAEGVRLLEMRESAVFPGHDHATEEAPGERHAPEHAHDDEHSHADGHAHDDDHAHADGRAEEAHDHAHGAHDPHVWLDPDNAAAIVRAVARALSEIDPDNADVYAANAEAALTRLEGLETELAATLAPVQDMPFVVFHDGYQYFEAAFGLEAVGAISMSDARMPSAARLSEVRARIEQLGAACVAAEPQFDAGLVEAVARGADIRTAVLDPIGVALEPGPALYGEMMHGLAEALAGCRAES